MNNFLDNIKGIIIAQIRADKTLGIITSDLLKTFLEDFRVTSEGRRLLNESEKKTLLKELSTYFIADLRFEQDLVELERGMTIINLEAKKHNPWEPSTIGRFYWRKQREFLLTNLVTKNNTEEAARIINSIDFETEQILKNMEDPLRHKFDSRGLVVGYIQSGKTANFTALVSKAADAGYRFILVLAGIHDELRQQTQIRIDRELTGHNNLNLTGNFIDWNDQEEPNRWLNLTSAGWLDGKETGEFSGKGINKFKDIFLNRTRPTIAIIKKNVSILNRLIKWVEDSTEAERKNVPILIIDDEADQASVDGNANIADTDPKKTNQKIRTILGLFTRTAYVGYTATPFANIFIKHDSGHDKFGSDLYPSNFIHSLPEPQGYFGTKKIFHGDIDKYFVTTIKDSRKEKKQIVDQGNITDDLTRAIYTFIISIAIRSLRGKNHQPMSMMINIDHRVTKMNRVGEKVKEYVESVLPKYFNRSLLIEVYQGFKESAREINTHLNTNNGLFESDVVADEALKIIISREIKVRVLNSSKDDKLDYAKEPSMKVIAIGGNKLSRGLTLEGLMTTFFLRESKQYDTLLQMGRWFGYRKGYEDLVRLYTTKTLWEQFTSLAIVELEFREDVKNMVEDGKTPSEFAIGVRHILGLLPTAKNKLGDALLEQFFGGKQVSVTRLLLEKTKLIDENEISVKKLITSTIGIGCPFSPINNNACPSRLAKAIPLNIIMTFLEKFNIAKDANNNYIDFDKLDLLKYIKSKSQKGALSKWNIGIISLNHSVNKATINLIEDIEVIPVNRARLKLSPVNGAYNIKALSSKADRKIDIDPNAKNEYENRQNPLLLIYIIDRNSSPVDKETDTREALYKGIEALARDPFAYSIIFPSDNKGEGRFIQSIN